MRYFFDSGGFCKAIITETTRDNAPTAMNADAASYLDGDIGRSTHRIYNVDGVLRGSNVVTLTPLESLQVGYVRFRISSASYFPVRFIIDGWDANARRTNASYITYTADNNIGGWYYQHKQYVKPDPLYGSGNQITVYTCDCYSCDCGSCFVAGSSILMADKSFKNIEDIKVGDKVIGIDGKVNTVLAPYSVRLGSKRSIISFEDDSLFLSAEHLMWVRGHAGEYWGTNDFHQYLREKGEYHIDGQVFKYDGLTRRQPYILSGDDEYAHVDGWKRQKTKVRREFGDDTMVYSMAVDGSHTYIVNGYVATGFVDDTDYDYSKIQWRGLAK